MRSWDELKGKKQLLITFFPRCFTGTCTYQLKSLRDSYAELQKADVEVWAISTDEADGPRGQRAFGKSLKLPFPLIPDPKRKLSLRFGAVESPLQMSARMSILFDKDGKVVWVDKQIDPRTHGADVLAKVKAQTAAATPLPAPPESTTAAPAKTE